MQSIEPALRRHRRSAAIMARDQPAIGAEAQPWQIIGYAFGVPPLHRDRGVAGCRIVHQDAARAAARPEAFGSRDDMVDHLARKRRTIRWWSLRRGGRYSPPREIAGISGHVAMIGALDRPGHKHARQRHQTGKADHQVEGQRHHTRDIVRVQPAALSLAWTKGEEIREDAPVRDDPADDRHQHGNRGKADQPASDPSRRIQVEVKIEEEIAAHRLARVQTFASTRVELFGPEAALRSLPENLCHRVARIG